MKERENGVKPFCPSAQPGMDESVAFGVIDGTAEAPRMVHLTRALPVTDELLALSGPVAPTEVFRFAAPCAGHSCRHFDGEDCRLVKRVVQILPSVASDTPPCTLRPTCRWWQQEGKAACARCPQIVTENYAPSEAMVCASDPNS